MEVGQGPNWGCSTKEKKVIFGGVQIMKLNKQFSPSSIISSFSSPADIFFSSNTLQYHFYYTEATEGIYMD
jgi:hypothetical protein